MELSILVAKLYAAIALLMGLGILINPSYYKKVFNDLINSGTAIFLNGIIATLAGLTLVTYHNIWESSWVVIITVIAWIALLKGVTLLVFPNTFDFIKPYYKKSGYWTFQAVALIIFGLILGYFGFVA